MYLFWLVFSDGDDRAVVIIEASSLIHARMQAALATLDAGVFVEAHQLDAKLSTRIPKKTVGRRLSKKDAATLLKRLDSR